MREFYRPPVIELEYRPNENCPIISGLKGPLGQPVLPYLDDMAMYYQENSSVLFRTTKTREGIEVSHNPLILITCGLPTSGKSSVMIELYRFFKKKGYILAPNITYEEVLAEEHPDLEKEIDFNTFQRIEKRLYQKIIAPIQTGYDSPPMVRLVEMPVFGRFTPSEKNDPNYKLNRPRGSLCVHLLSKMRFENFNTLPIHLLALTGNLQTQTEAIEHRHRILNQPEDDLNQYLWDNELLNPNLEIDPQKVQQLVKHMAMPKHWVTILEEFGDRESIYKKNIKEKNLEFAIDLALRIYEQRLGRRTTVQEIITLIRMLTFDFFLRSLGVPEDRILDGYNPYNPELKQAFFNNVSAEQ